MNFLLLDVKCWVLPIGNKVPLYFTASQCSAEKESTSFKKTGSIGTNLVKLRFISDNILYDTFYCK